MSELSTLVEQARSGAASAESACAAARRLCAMTPSASDAASSLPAMDAAVRDVIRQPLGRIVDVGSVPQAPVALTAAAVLAACGTPVVLAAAVPPETMPWLRRMAEHVQEETGLTVSVLAHRVPAPRKNEDYESADMSIVDIVRLGDEVHRDVERFRARNAVLFAFEADVCLYDRRLLVYEKQVLRVAAAVVSAGGELPEWFEHENLFDWKDGVRAFRDVGGVAGAVTRDAAAEIESVYGLRVHHVRGPASGRLPRSLIYRTIEEKLDALGAAIASGPATGVRDLVLAAWPWTGDWVQQAVRARGLPVARAGDRAGLLEALRADASDARVVIYTGLPPSDLPGIEIPGRLRIRIAEPLLLPHHYAKVEAFRGNTAASVAARPELFFAIEDAEDIWVVTTGGLLDRAFRLMDGLQGLRVAGMVRAWTGGRLLASCYRMRRKYWREDAPLFTWYNGRPRKPSRKARKGSAARLDAPCFCGSGKPFRECHGRFMSSKGKRG